MTNHELRAQFQTTVIKRNELAEERKAISEEVKAKTDKMVSIISLHGPQIGYDKNDRPVVFNTKLKDSVVLNKVGLSVVAGLSPRKLTASKIGELIEKGSLTADQVAEYEDHKQTVVLTRKKATKKDLATLNPQV